MTKNQKISRDVNGITVEQRVTDGFINGTTMCVAHSKKINDWFRTGEVLELFFALADDLELGGKDENSRNLDAVKLSASKYAQLFPELVISRSGSPENGGGTWLHPDLAIQLAQWCSAPFAIQVSRWVRDWMTSGQNPIWVIDDVDRLTSRNALKDDARLRMTAQVKIYLEQIKRYDDAKYRGMFFAQVHDSINCAITGETAKQMRVRLSQTLGKNIKESELIRDYFPTLDLQRYIALCEASANFMLRENLHPLTAVERAAEIVLPASYIPRSIDFTENISSVRGRLITLLSGQTRLSLP
jgi:hypothetical protein